MKPGEESTALPRLAAVYAVTRHELRMLLYAPLSYLFLVGFLLALSTCIFLVADFYASDEASIELMLLFLPWVAMILVPALAMGMWTGPGGDGGAELAMTLPTGAGAQVIGKFLAGYGVLLLALLLTWPLAGTVFYLGEPDPGVMAGGYLASALVLAVYFAIALLCAAVAREQVGAFVLGLACLFLLQLLGWDALGRILRDAVPPGVMDSLALYSPNTWLREMGHGWFDMAGLAYFVGLTAAALYGASRVVDGWRTGPWTPARVGRGLAVGAVLIGGVVLTVGVLSRSSSGIALTAEREFTLHDGTVEILNRLPEGTEATLYWSASESSVPTAIKSHARRARTLLRTLADRSSGRLLIREIDPQPDSDEEIEAQRGGLRPVPMSSGDRFFLGLTAEQGGRTASIGYLDTRRERLLEYDLALALNNLGRERPRDEPPGSQDSLGFGRARGPSRVARDRFRQPGKPFVRLAEQAAQQDRICVHRDLDGVRCIAAETRDDSGIEDALGGDLVIKASFPQGREFVIDHLSALREQLDASELDE